MSVDKRGQDATSGSQRFSRQGGRFRDQEESTSAQTAAPSAGSGSGFQGIDTPDSFKRSASRYTDSKRRSSRGTRLLSADEAAQDGGSAHSYVGYSALGSSGAKKRNPLITVGIAAGVLLVLVVLGILAYNFISGSLSESAAEAGVEKEIFISEGSSTTAIAQLLKGEGVIDSESDFVADVKSRNAESQLKPGKYIMLTGSSNSDVITALVAGPSALGNTLTIPEGLTVEQTAGIVEEVCAIPAADFIAEAKSADKYFAEDPERYWFLESVYDNSTEGFLYPKTYVIPEGSDAAYVVHVLLDQFVIETAELDMSYAQEHNLNIYDVITMASMIEKETYTAEEKPKVASVLYNRLQNDMLLQICSTVVYVLGPDARDYGVNPLLYVDLEVDSPYNTYIYEGLPPGPICSPHIDSINAAAHPDETDYFYYVLTSQDGTHTFCTNEEEFAAANKVYAEVFGL